MHHYNGSCTETSCILSVCRRLFVSRAVCLPSGYDARHCHKIPRKTRQKNGAFPLQECEERAVSAIFGPAGLSGRWKRLMSHGDTRRTSIHVTAACLPPTADGIKRLQAWRTRQATLRDTGRICRRVAQCGHLMKDERVLVLIRCPSHVLHARNVHVLSVWVRISKQKECTRSNSLFTSNIIFL